ncbi:DUF2169 family type VI secretion system accessory protein [Neoroseomonas soli]|uniref:DUF2169 domain-containing protein n=1 Tax=Neoroseomonas soli TaxID=1081025 RepID=A0A9X9X1J5_9PROT|nr:DUF2169 domain-containing protein [Neoroseomonas soli]MBR0673274.1 DUF2169 domain-containing protein [Neoroseomonas soli]
MKILKPFALGVLSRPVEFQRRFFLTVAAVSFCPMGDRPGLLGDIAMWKFLPTVLPPEQPLDLVLPKTAAEFLVAGSAFAPGGAPVQTVTVSARLGAVTKRLAAVGDRWIEDGVPTQPLPFTEMPLGWDRAYGGKKYPQNPLGRGIDEVPIQGVGFRVTLPNVVLPQGAPRPSSPEPVNFGPIDISWPQRQRLAGTHDQRWLDEDFPGFARDIDWRVFMAANPDQRFAGFLKGDEDYAFTNMHAEEPELTGRLPGLQPRILIERRGSGRLEDVPLSLTTVWFFPARKRLVMIHHGRVRVDEEDARDVTLAIVGADRLGAPRPVSAFEAVMAARLEPEYGLLEAMRDSALVPEEMIVPDPDMEEARIRHEEQGLLRKRAHQRRLKEYEKQRQSLVELGLDPDKHGPPRPQEEEPVPSLEQLPAVIERVRAESEKVRRESEAFMAKEQAEAEAAAAAAGQPVPDLKKKPAGPPPFSAARTRSEMEAEAAQMQAEGRDAAIVHNTLADPAIGKLWVDAEEGERKAYLLAADQQDPAPRLDAAANAALRVRLLDGSRGGPRLDLCGADLSGLDLSGFDLTEAWLDGANLTGANLRGAKLERAVLAHARLEGANLSRADLEEANLGRASLVDTDLSDAILRGAVLRGADLRRARFEHADLTGAVLGDASLEGADLAGVVAPNLVLSEATLTGLRAAGAMLEGAVFVKVNLAGADFTGADLRKVAFVGSRGQGAVFDGADLSKAAFAEACDFTGARFARARCLGTNLRGTVLEGAVFDGAVLDDSDLSDCRLQGASFDMTRARQTRFVVADLRGARITRADLMGASLARADIRGADLSDSSLYEADLARIHGDGATRYERTQRTRVRLNPRRTPT